MAPSYIITTDVMSSNPAQGDALDTTLCDEVCQWLVTGWWLSPVSSTIKLSHDITEILLKVALNTIILIPNILITVNLLTIDSRHGSML